MARLRITAARHSLRPSRSAAGGITSNTRPEPALAMCSAAARVGLRGRFGAKRCPAGCATAWCANDPARTAADPVPRPLPYWRQHSKCTCCAAAWRKASSSITSCTSQGSAVSSLVSAAWWLAPHGQRVAQVLQLLRLRCWKRARTQQSGALHAPQAKVELVFQRLHLCRICAEQGRWVPQTALVPAGAQPAQQKLCKLQRLLLRRQLGLRCQSAHPAFC